MSVSLAPSSGFLDRCREVFSNSDNIVEGSLWGSLFGFSIHNLTSAISKRQEADALPESSPEKAHKIWSANKEVLGTSCSAASATSLLVTWLNDLRLIGLGSLIAPFVSIGAGAGAIGSLLKLSNLMEAIDQSTIAYQQAQDPLAKTDIALGFFKKMIEVALYTASAAWGIFGCLYAAIGGAALFALADLAFYYVFILFLVNLGSAILLPILANYKKSL